MTLESPGRRVRSPLAHNSDHQVLQVERHGELLFTLLALLVDDMHSPVAEHVGAFLALLLLKLVVDVGVDGFELFRLLEPSTEHVPLEFDLIAVQGVLASLFKILAFDYMLQKVKEISH